MKSKRIIIAMLLAVIVAVPISIYLFFKIGMEEPYQRFRADEEKAIPLFDTLNKDVYSQVPTPLGVEEIEQHHSMFLQIDYRIVNTTAEQVSKLYYQFLSSNGWKDYNGGSFLYYRGTSCFSINLRYQYKKDEYEVVIYHDYFKQKFSPVLPPVWIIQFFEFGERTFAHCPPEPGIDT